MPRCARRFRTLLVFGALAAFFLIGASPPPAVRAATRGGALPAPASAPSPTLTRGASGACVGGLDWFAARRAARGPPPEPLVAMSRAQRAANARVLLVTSDTRPLEADWAKRTYWALAVAANRAYARAHGYDFAFVHTFARAPAPAGLFSNATDAACFHFGFGIWRVHNWCKILAMWAATAGAPGLYDLVVYIDSDAVIQDVGADISEAWAPRNGNVVFGPPFCAGGGGGGGGGALAGTTLAGCAADAANASARDALFLIYSDNSPGDPANPNLGFYVMRAAPPRTRSLLRDWWDFVDAAHGHLYATYAFHEQTGMYRLMRGAWGAAVTVTDSRWAPDAEARLVRHINSEENRYGGPAGLRVGRFTRLLAERGMGAAEFEREVAETLASCDAVDLDVLAVARDIEGAREPRHKG